MSVNHCGRILSVLGSGALLLAGCDRKPAALLPPAEAAPVAFSSLQAPELKKEPGTAPNSEPAAGEGFPFTADQGGQLLAKLLPPPEKHFSTRADAQGQRRLPGPPAVEDPSVVPLSDPLGLPRLRDAARRSVRPGPLPGEALATGSRPLPLPSAQQLPAVAGVRLPSLDVNQPPPLPLLARPVPDRASLEDPTADASATAAVAAPAAERTGPAAFLRLILPEPFENRVPIRGPVPEEDPVPPVGPARLPKP